MPIHLLLSLPVFCHKSRRRNKGMKTKLRHLQLGSLDLPTTRENASNLLGRAHYLLHLVE
jgi:hypothetical protein